MNELLSAVDIGSTYNSPFGSGGKTISDLIDVIMTGSIAVAGILLLVFLIGAGIAIMGGSGQGKPESIEKAKKAATSAAVGFLIIVMTWFIIGLIEYLTGSNFITDPGI